MASEQILVVSGLVFTEVEFVHYVLWSSSGYSACSWFFLISNDLILDTDLPPKPRILPLTPIADWTSLYLLQVYKCTNTLLRLSHGFHLDHDLHYLLYSLCFGGILFWIPVSWQVYWLSLQCSYHIEKREIRQCTLDNLSSYRARTLEHSYIHSSFSSTLSPLFPLICGPEEGFPFLLCSK